MVKTGDHFALIHSFQTYKVDSEVGKANLAVIVLDLEGSGKSFDIVVKDLDQDLLMPVLILNSDGQVAFDQLAGFYYTQVDAAGLGKRVFRHQVGTTQKEDVLVYDEGDNTQFSVTVENTLSKEFVMLKITSTFKPACNEVWIKNVKEAKSKFWLVQAVQ